MIMVYVYNIPKFLGRVMYMHHLSNLSLIFLWSSHDMNEQLVYLTFYYLFIFRHNIDNDK